MGLSQVEMSDLTGSNRSGNQNPKYFSVAIAGPLTLQPYLVFTAAVSPAGAESESLNISYGLSGGGLLSIAAFGNFSLIEIVILLDL
jgi:hypothetical protein